ncbi:MAG: hypothetical protein KGI51_03860 [Rhodospirillales bacterium]|nr:hypothetical protein [Rhodospirillales bacterium]
MQILDPGDPRDDAHMAKQFDLDIAVLETGMDQIVRRDLRIGEQAPGHRTAFSGRGER